MKKTEKNEKLFTVNVTENDAVILVDAVKNVSQMWLKAKEIFAAHPSCRILVSDIDGNPFKDLHLEKKATDKSWMVNAVKETNRKKKVKTEEDAVEAPTEDAVNVEEAETENATETTADAI